MALALCASSSVTDQKLMQNLLRHENKDFLALFLQTRGIQIENIDECVASAGL